jgi:phosphocarrier protein HPr
MSASAEGRGEDQPNESPAEPSARDDSIVRVFTICNKKGLHARASAKFVQTVEKFDADVRVTRGSETVGGTSIMGLMMLAASPGTAITVEASGNEAAEVIEALAALIAARFGEDD